MNLLEIETRVKIHSPIKIKTQHLRVEKIARNF
jgi:hypothetical protein